MKDIKALIKDARLPEETVPIFLRGDLVADFEVLERELEQARATPADSLAGNGVRQLEERLAELRRDMEESKIVFRLRALPDETWYRLADQHPPREVDGKPHPRDELGVNSDSFFPALLKVSVVEPELDEEDWAALGTALTARQRYDLNSAAWRLNRGEVDVPFSHAASAILSSEAE